MFSKITTSIASFRITFTQIHINAFVPCRCRVQFGESHFWQDRSRFCRLASWYRMSSFIFFYRSRRSFFLSNLPVFFPNICVRIGKKHGKTQYKKSAFRPRESESMSFVIEWKASVYFAFLIGFLIKKQIRQSKRQILYEFCIVT